MRDLTEIAEPPELTDGRLRLRALRPEDKPAVVAALNDELSARFLWQPPFPYTEADFDEFHGAKAAAWPEEPDAFWIAADAADDSVLAAISLHLHPETETGEIGYWCGPWARRRGVMTAALRLVRDWAFDELGVQRLEIGADLDNVGSQRVAMAAGFIREGVAARLAGARGRARSTSCTPCCPATHARLRASGEPAISAGRG